MNKIITAAILIATSTLASARSANGQRVEVPVYLGKQMAFIDLVIGQSKPLSMFIDTGAGGIRVFPNNINDSDVQHTGVENRIAYADGSSGLIGETVRGEVKIGEFIFPGATPLQLIKHHFCKHGSDEQCGGVESKHGGAGTIGIGVSDRETFQRFHKKTEVVNPFTSQGPFSYILKVPSDSNSKGSLIINPTEAEKSRFVKLRVEGRTIPVCINRLCFSVLVDSGNGGNAIPVASRRDLKLLGLPANDEKIADGTTVPITFGTGKNSFTVNVTATERGPAKFKFKESAEEHGVLGINLFHFVDVLYDFESGIIGFASKE